MRFYIATGLVNAEHARKAAEVLRRNGHEQTCLLYTSPSPRDTR